MIPTVRSLLRVAHHRPWPIPARPWLMRQSWHDVLFAHWAVDADPVSALLPQGLELEVADGGAWIGVVAFEIRHARLRGLPPLPGVSRFPEVNVRTYVRAGGRAGVYFFSLDARSLVAVKAARWGLGLPYHLASMAMQRDSGGIRFRSRRSASRVSAQIDVTYRPQGAIGQAVRGTRDHFFVERYCLFALDHRRHLYELDIHHPPWALQAVSAEVSVNTLIEAVGVIPRRGAGPVLHYAARQDMLAWWPAAPGGERGAGVGGG